MSIAMNAAISGVRVPLARQDVAAHNIANMTTPGFEQMNANQVEMATGGVQFTGTTRTPNPDSTTSGTDLAQQMVNMTINKNDMTANLKVLKTQDKMIGEVIDLLA